MTVAELKAILSTLPDDTEIFVNHERIKLAPPELFLSHVSDVPRLVIVATGTSALEDAQARYYWRHLTKPSRD